LPEAGPLVERAPAKVNLTLRVLGRRPDGYHELESLVAFADIADRVELVPRREPGLTLRGTQAHEAGPPQDNLVLKAAAALCQTIARPRLGHFVLTKGLPVAGGLGGGSADAAAALRLLARLNELPATDGRLLAAAEATGSDVPVCLASSVRMMRGRGDILSPPLDLPALPAVLANPGVTLPTREVFAALDRPFHTQDAGEEQASPPARTRTDLIAFLQESGNDLEALATRLRPVVAEVLGALRALQGVRLARMSGSGATCFAILDSARAAQAAARTLRERQPGWWVKATRLGDGGV
jgi:4-diphosphocytidyl-2-C-methyl-D-erythritol kinase